MQWFKTENIVNGLQKLDWSVVNETQRYSSFVNQKSNRHGYSLPSPLVSLMPIYAMCCQGFPNLMWMLLSRA